jgi:hypothetical protein
MGDENKMTKTRVRVQTVSAQDLPTYVSMTVSQALDLVAALVSTVRRDKGTGTVYMHVFQRGKSLYVRNGGARRKK